MKERFNDVAGMNPQAVQRVFGFGSHPQATAGQAHHVTNAYANADADEAISCNLMTFDCIGTGNTNHLRIIFDELLLGNNLEELECNDGSFQQVPVGATPTDIANCTTPPDVLPETCKGPNAVCLCANDAGCTVTTSTSPTPLMYTKGQPVGVLDTNGDGAADVFRFINGAVGLKCGAINVPIDLDEHGTSSNTEFTYYNPSGNQQIPATGGFEALGPAVILKPLGPLPTNLDCGLVFSPDVVDKQGNQVCAPPEGRPGDGSKTPDCTPGDVSSFSFHTESLTVLADADHTEGMTGVSRTEPVALTANVPLDPASVTGITVLEGATNYTTFTVMLDAATSRRITITSSVVTGFVANQTYTITVPATLHDTFMQAMPAPFVLHFTTGS
jgi:hypothetical protein